MENRRAQPSARWRSGGCFQRQITPQAAGSFGQPRPLSWLGSAGRLSTEHANSLGAQCRCASGARRYGRCVAGIEEQVRHAVRAVGRTLSQRLLHRLGQHLLQLVLLQVVARDLAQARSALASDVRLRSHVPVVRRLSSVRRVLHHSDLASGRCDDGAGRAARLLAKPHACRRDGPRICNCWSSLQSERQSRSSERPKMQPTVAAHCSAART